MFDKGVPSAERAERGSFVDPAKGRESRWTNKRKGQNNELNLVFRGRNKTLNLENQGRPLAVVGRREEEKLRETQARAAEMISKHNPRVRKRGGQGRSDREAKKADFRKT